MDAQKRRRIAPQQRKVLAAMSEVADLLPHIPTAESDAGGDQGGPIKLFSETESEESDTARLHDLAEQHGLAFQQVSGIYLFDGYTAHGLEQALGYAEGFDRARHYTPPTDEDIATWIPGADYGNPAEIPRLHDLAKKHGLLFRQFGNTYKFLDFNAHGLEQAQGYVEGFDRAMAASRSGSSDV